MKTKVLLIIIFLSSLANAQDIIKKKNGEFIEAKKVAIKGPTVYYHKYNVKSDFEITVHRDSLEYIQLENGKRIELTTPYQSDSLRISNKFNDKKEDLIMIDGLGMVTFSLNLGYEMDFRKHPFSVRSHVSFSPSNFDNSKSPLFPNGNLISAGSAFHINVGKAEKTFKYFVGPMLRGGMKRYSDSVYNNTQETTSSYVGLYLTQGATWKFKNRFVLSLEAAIGRNVYFEHDYDIPIDGYVRLYLGYNLR